MKKFLLFFIICINIVFANNVSLLNLQNIENSWRVKVNVTPPVNVDKTIVSNGEDSKEVIFNTDIDTTISFLIDTSVPMKASFKKGIRPLLTKLDLIKQPKEKWIVSYFDDDIHTVYDDEKTNIETLPNILKLIQVNGHRTELWRSTKVAINDLSSRVSSRKILVVITDGEAEDTNAYTRDDVIKAANDAGIKIVTLAYRDTIGTQNLRRISEDTSGGFWKANRSTHKLSSNFYKEFMKLVRSSGTINIPVSLIHPTETGKQDLNITFEHELKRSFLTITIDTEKIVTVEENTTIEDVVEENTTVEDVVEENTTEAIDDNVTKIEEEVKPKTFFEKYKLYLAIVGALLALLLLYFLMRKKPIATDNGNDVTMPGADFSGKTIVNGNTQSTMSSGIVDDGATMIHNANNANVPSEPIAYLLASDGTKLNISHLPAKIGKSADNDVVISDKFMSRHHATLVNKNGSFYIVDNNSSNGVIVNGNKIINEKQVLDGNSIYFGPYKTTFHVVKNNNKQFGSDDEKTRWIK